MVYSGVGHAPPRNAASLVATGFIVMVEFAHFNRDEEEFPMTEDRLLIEELAAKGGQPDFLRTIAENVLQLIMEADVDGLIGAGRHERSRSEEHTSELQSLMRISYAVFCLKTNKHKNKTHSQHRQTKTIHAETNQSRNTNKQ